MSKCICSVWTAVWWCLCIWIRTYSMLKCLSPPLFRLRVAPHLTRSASPTSTDSTLFSTTWSWSGRSSALWLATAKMWKSPKVHRDKKSYTKCIYCMLTDTAYRTQTHKGNVWHKVVLHYREYYMCFSRYCIYVCVFWGWKLVFVWFSCFPVAFKWACWMWPSTRTAYPQSLMEPVLSIRHSGTDLRTALFVLACFLGFNEIFDS